MRDVYKYSAHVGEGEFAGDCEGPESTRCSRPEPVEEHRAYDALCAEPGMQGRAESGHGKPFRSVD